MGEQSARIGLRWLVRLGAPVAIALLVANCAAGTGERVENPNTAHGGGGGGAGAGGGGSFRVGKPYNINGRTYLPAENPTYRAEGIASWYGPISTAG